MKKLIGILSILSIVLNSSILNAQIGTDELSGADKLNTITTAVPFLLIAPDSRAGGMGDVGVATSPSMARR